jgi:3-dehydroquinate synthase
MPEVIPINLPPVSRKTYDVVIGQDLLPRLAEDLAGGLLGRLARYVIVTDDTVDQLYGDAVLKLLSDAGLQADKLVFHAGETYKSRRTKGILEDELIRLGCHRDTGLIALGGGVVTDLVGFLAATFMRGVPYVAVPTTILGAADASIGGKTGVNTDAGKNLIGAFYHPSRVYIDIDFWKSLPKEQVQNGLAETVKHAVVADAAYFAYLERHLDRIVSVEEDPALDTEACLHIARMNCLIKQQVVEADEKENGVRVILNFGHTVGHAVEAQSKYTLLHGFAVSIGMVQEARLAAHLGHVEDTEVRRLTELLRRIGLPTELPALMEIDDIVARTYQDKKVRAGKVNYVLLDGIGYVKKFDGGQWCAPVPDDVVRQVLHGAR